MAQHITCYFDSHQFVMSHMRRPKGFGSWAFEFEGKGPVFTPAMTYGDAKKWIAKHIKTVAPADFTGAVLVKVLP